MSKLNEWAERCQQDGIEVWRLEHESDITGLYMTKKKISNILYILILLILFQKSIPLLQHSMKTNYL